MGPKASPLLAAQTPMCRSHLNAKSGCGGETSGGTISPGRIGRNKIDKCPNFGTHYFRAVLGLTADAGPNRDPAQMSLLRLA